MINLGIDIGNFGVKDSNHVTYESGCIVTDTPMVDNSNTYYMNGKFYTVGKRSPLNKQKTCSESMWQISLPCIAEAILKNEGYNGRTENIRLGIGLPVNRFGKECNDFVEYYYSRGQDPVRLEYKGNNISFRITEVKAYPQGTSVYVANFQRLKEFDYLVGIDIGGGTIDITIVEDYKLIPSKCFSIEHGVIDLINNIADQLRIENIILSESQICNTVKNKNLRHQKRELILSIVKKCTEHYITDIKGQIAERGIDLGLPAIVMGGGAVLLEKEFNENLDVMENFGAFANAEAYRTLLEVSR